MSLVLLRLLKVAGVPTVHDIPGPYRLFFYSYDCREPQHVPVRQARDARQGARAVLRGWCFDGPPGVTRGNEPSGAPLSTRGFVTVHGCAIGAAQAASGCVQPAQPAVGEHAPRLVTPRAGEGVDQRLVRGRAGGVASRLERQGSVLAAQAGPVGEDLAQRQGPPWKRRGPGQDGRRTRLDHLRAMPQARA